MCRCIRRFLQDDAGHATLGYAVVSVLALGVVYTTVAVRGINLNQTVEDYREAARQARTTQIQQPAQVP